MKRGLPYIGIAVGLTLLILVIKQANMPLLIQTMARAGYDLLWLIPYRVLFFLFYAIGWLLLLHAADPQRQASLRYLFWVTAIREGVDRLLPVASVGGSIIGIRLLRWKSLGLAPATASVILEIVLTLVASYIFTALGLALFMRFATVEDYRNVLLVLVASLPIPVICLLLLRYGSLFGRLQARLSRLLGNRLPPSIATAVDGALRVSLQQRSKMVTVAMLQLAALISGSFEVWFAMRVFGHPINAGAAIALESLTQAVRHVAFIVPGGLGIQEAGLVLFGHVLGIESEAALATSMAKRMREIAWGLPALLSWQYAEMRRLQQMARCS